MGKMALVCEHFTLQTIFRNALNLQTEVPPYFLMVVSFYAFLFLFDLICCASFSLKFVVLSLLFSYSVYNRNGYLAS